jgi:hypothetical protein
MIDRKALWICIAVFVATTGAAIWQVSLLPDWRHMPLGGPGSHDTVSGLVLFATPASLLLFLLSPFIQWLALPKESLPSLRRWSGKWIVSMSVVMALLQAFVLTRSLGIVSPSGLGMARGGSVIIGVMFMVMGNITPKMPVPPRRNSIELDSWDASRMLRFGGKLLVGLGLAFVLGGILLPPEYWARVFGSLMLTALAAGIWYGIKLRHERSLQSARTIITSDS